MQQHARSTKFISQPDLKNRLVQTCQEKDWLKVSTVSSSSNLQTSRLQGGSYLLLAPSERGSNLDAPPLDQGGGDGGPAACLAASLDAPTVGKRRAWRQHCISCGVIGRNIDKNISSEGGSHLEASPDAELTKVVLFLSYVASAGCCSRRSRSSRRAPETANN